MMPWWWILLVLGRGPVVTTLPEVPVAGAFVTVVVRVEGRRSKVEGEMGGEPLHFELAEDSTWRALGGVPVATEDSVEVRLVPADGERADSSSHWIRLTATNPPV